MKLSTTAQYALRVLSFMAVSEEKNFSTKKLSEELDIPYKYLTRIITNLVNANLLQSTLGRGGGISFLKKLNQIKVIDVLQAIDDTDREDCVIGMGKCTQEKKCIVHDKWKSVKCNIERDFFDLTLDEFNNG